MVVTSTLAVAFARARASELDERGQEAIDADRGPGRGHAFAEESHDEIVVASAAEHRPELRGVEQLRLEHGAGVVGEAPGDAEIDAPRDPRR